MAIAVDVAVESVRTGTGTPHTWSHAGASSGVKGILVAAIHGTSSTDHISAVTYGGASLVRVRRSADAAGEPGAAEWWFLGDGVLQGTQTVSVTCGATTDDFQFVSITLLGDGNCFVVDTDGLTADQADPSVTLNYLGLTCQAFGALYSGQNAPASFTPNGNCTTDFSEDLGNFSGIVFHQTTPGSSDFAIGGTSTSEDVAFAAIAVTDSKISRVGAGSISSGTSSATPSYPSGLASGDMLILSASSKYNAADAPDGWTLLASASGGSGASGVDTGTVHRSLFYKISDGTETGTVTVNVPSGNSMSTRIVAYRPASGRTWSISATTASDNSAGTGVSFTGAANLDLAAGDWLLPHGVVNSDAYSYSSHAVTATGVSVLVDTAIAGGGFQEGPITDGDDMELLSVVTGLLIASGPSSAAPVWTATASGSAANAPAGACVFVRLRTVITVTLGQATETDTAQAVTRLKTLAIGQATETDAAQAVTRVKARTLGQASETDEAQPVAVVEPTITVEVGQASETDTAQALARLKTLIVGQVSETDAAQAVGRLKTLAIGQAAETDLAQAIAHVLSRVLGQASETDSAQTLGRLKTLALGIASELDTAQAVGRLKTVLLGQALELDEAQPVTDGGFVVVVQQATEVDVAQAIGRGKALLLGVAGEVDEAQAVAALKTIAIGQAAEIDEAMPVVAFVFTVTPLGRVIVTARMVGAFVAELAPAPRTEVTAEIAGALVATAEEV